MSVSEVVVPLRSSPPVSDIVGQLRSFADDIEAGAKTAESMLVIVPVEDGWPELYGWGEYLGDYGNIAVLELAKAWFISNPSARRSL